MLVARRLGAVRGGATLFSGVDIRVGRGDALLLSGPIGSGKTTCMRVLAGFEQPDHGDVLLHGVPVASWRRWRREEAAPFVDQDPRLDLDVRAVDNLIDNVLLSQRWQWWAWSKARARRAAKDQAADLLAAAGLVDAIDRGAWELSYGQRRVLTVVRALRPLSNGIARVMLLDEPFAGLHDARVDALIALINRRLAEGWGLVVAEHLAAVRRLEITCELEFPAIRA